MPIETKDLPAPSFRVFPKTKHSQREKWACIAKPQPRAESSKAHQLWFRSWIDQWRLVKMDETTAVKLSASSAQATTFVKALVSPNSVGGMRMCI